MTVDNPGAPGTGSLPADAENLAKHDLQQASDKLSKDFSAAGEQAKHDVEAVKREVQSQAGAAVDQAKSFATDQKGFAAQQITGVASAISKVADELDGDQATTAKYARDLAGGIDRFGKTVENKSVDELMHMAQQFGRSQPLAFLGAAALAGFVASRFAGASAQRQDHASAPTPNQRPTAAGSYSPASSPAASVRTSGQTTTSAQSSGNTGLGGNNNVTG